MKRRWFGVFLMMWAVLAPLFAFAPAAEAAASGRCVPTIVHCVIFNVTLSPAPTGPVVVTATRQAPLGIDDTFTLDCTGANCSSVNVVWGTSGIDTNCVNGGFQNVNFFIVTVTSGGTEIGRGPRINLCHNEVPKADSAGIKTQSITIAGTGSTLGGIKGSFATINLAGKSVPCATGTTVTFASPSGTGTTTVGGGGSFDSGLNLKPDSYNVTVNCPGTGGPGNISVPGVVVQPNQITDIGLQTCTAAVCGAPPPPPPPTTSPAPDPGKVACDAGAGFTWVICGIIILFVGENGIVNTIRDNIIVPFLKEPPLDKDDPQFTAAYNVWSAFRNLSSVFFILVFFLIIIGTAAGFDNYTIKKVLPHLVAGAILVPFSWYLCAFVIDIGNVLGQGLVTLIGPIIGTPSIDITTNWASIFGLGAGAAVTAFALYGAATTIGLPLIITLLLSFLGVFLTLIFRKIVLIALVVISPIALLAWVLPNTEKWFKIWWQDFLKLVMMYPIILMLFEAGRLASVTAGATVAGPGLQGAATNFVRPLVQITALILPLFAVPFAFKFAGRGLSMASNASSKITGAADKRFGKDSDGAKEAAENRTRNNLLRARRLNTSAANAAASGNGVKAFGLGLASRAARRRAGFTKPLRKNDSAEIKEEAAYAKAAGEKGIVGANAANSAHLIPKETVDERIQAETIAAQNKKIADRSARMALVKDANDLGPAGVAAGNRAKYEAGVESGARQAATQRGDAIGYNIAVREKPQSLMLVGQVATEHAEHKEYAARGEMEVGVESGHELDEAAEEAENAVRRKAGSPTITIEQAHRLRMDNVARAAGENARVKALQSEVDVSATLRSEDDLNADDIAKAAAQGTTITAATARRLRMVENLSAGSSQGRDAKIGNMAKTRLYNEVEHDADGPESAANILAGERALQRQGVVDARQKRIGALDSQLSKPVATSDMLKASRYAAGKAAGAQAGGTEAALSAMATEARRDKVAVGTDEAFAASAARSYTAAASVKARQLVKSFGQEQGVITADDRDVVRMQGKARGANKLSLKAGGPGVATPTAADVRATRLGNLAQSSSVSSSRAATSELAQDQAAVTDARSEEHTSELQSRL